MQPGSLFPALHRLEEAGALSSSWQPSENNRRAKFYALTKAGRRRLGDETAQWNRVAIAIAHALETLAMRRSSRCTRLWRNLRHRDRVERDLDDEMQATLDLLIDEKVAAGIDPREARRRAMIELNRIEPIKERVRDVRAGMLMDTLLQDLKYAVAPHAPRRRASPRPRS